MKVTGLTSTSQEQKSENPHYRYRNVKLIGSNSGSACVEHRAVKFACSMGMSSFVRLSVVCNVHVPYSGD